MTDTLFPHAVIIGLGLIGSSLARDLRALGLCERLTGIDPDEDNCRILLSGGTLDEAFALPSTDHLADLLLIATPPSSWPHLSQVLPALTHAESLIMDVGSVKARAAEWFTPAFMGRGTFIPCHPIAGKESSGAAAGQQGLFENRKIILCPAEGTPETPIRIAHAFWQALGGLPEMMPADVHDRIYALVSHLPQMVAYAAMRTLAPYLGMASSDLHRPFLRLAGSPPSLWADIALANAAQLGEAMETFLHIVTHMRSELEAGTGHDVAPQSDMTVTTALFPRLIASSLVSAVSLSERKHRLKMAPYAGTGFADVASPAARPPEEDMESISAYYAEVAALMREFEAHFRTLFLALREQNRTALLDYMETAQTLHRTSHRA